MYAIDLIMILNNYSDSAVIKLENGNDFTVEVIKKGEETLIIKSKEEKIEYCICSKPTTHSMGALPPDYKKLLTICNECGLSIDETSKGNEKLIDRILKLAEFIAQPPGFGYCSCSNRKPINYKNLIYLCDNCRKPSRKIMEQNKRNKKKQLNK